MKKRPARKKRSPDEARDVINLIKEACAAITAGLTLLICITVALRDLNKPHENKSQPLPAVAAPAPPAQLAAEPSENQKDTRKGVNKNEGIRSRRKNRSNNRQSKQGSNSTHNFPR